MTQSTGTGSPDQSTYRGASAHLSRTIHCSPTTLDSQMICVISPSVDRKAGRSRQVHSERVSGLWWIVQSGSLLRGESPKTVPPRTVDYLPATPGQAGLRAVTE